MSNVKINRATIDLVKQFEGLELKAYRDPIGVWTIGYGYSERASFGPGVKEGDVWTEGMAEDMLREGLQRYGDDVLKYCEYTPTENQFGAMTSLAYNIGVGAFAKSTCLKRFNARDIVGAAEALTWFNKAGGKKLNGLVRRRAAEKVLFLTDTAAEVTPQADPERSKTQSKTLRNVGVGLTGTGATLLSRFADSLGENAQLLLVGGIVVVALAFILISKDKVKEWNG